MRAQFARISFAVLCATESACTPKSEPGSLVVGLTEGLRGAASDVALSVRIESADAGVLRLPMSALPYELMLEEPAGNAIALVDVALEAIDSSGQPVLHRLASTRFVPAQRKLLRVRLEALCLGPDAPTCTPPQTCISGRCAHSFVLPEDLESYASDWASDRPDACRPDNTRPPEVVLGTGQTAYEPLAEGQTLKLEKGPQGGHHLWFSARVKNLKQAGAKITLSSVEPETGLTVPPTGFVLNLAGVGDGMCVAQGLRYQVDGGVDYHRFWGKRLDVTAEVGDVWGRTATTTVSIQVASGD